MSRAFVVGEKPLVLGFQGVGFEIVHAADAAQFGRALERLARAQDVGLVLVTESLAAEAPEAIRLFREVSTAILTAIPTHKGSDHNSFNEMRKSVERSIGVDMLGKE